LKYEVSIPLVCPNDDMREKSDGFIFHFFLQFLMNFTQHNGWTTSGNLSQATFDQRWDQKSIHFWKREGVVTHQVNIWTFIKSMGGTRQKTRSWSYM